MSQPILQAKELTRTYGRVVALDGANLELYPGEVLAVVGDNGAGKSTLIKCLSGAEVPESGTITLDGNDVNFKRPQDGRAAGDRKSTRLNSSHSQQSRMPSSA